MYGLRHNIYIVFQLYKCNIELMFVYGEDFNIKTVILLSNDTIIPARGITPSHQQRLCLLNIQNTTLKAIIV